MTIHVSVPATSANLGPGFDSLGLTLDLWNELEAEQKGETLQISIEGEGHQEIARDKNNAIYRACRHTRKGTIKPCQKV
jgi:homoserine kinase